ncbi:hypothetical protein HG531_000628 [Fusarium graminearum]|nr:hypothetical protein HG531_000628 [Fusarium graminearum]
MFRTFLPSFLSWAHHDESFIHLIDSKFTHALALLVQNLKSMFRIETLATSTGQIEQAYWQVPSSGVRDEQRCNVVLLDRNVLVLLPPPIHMLVQFVIIVAWIPVCFCMTFCEYLLLFGAHIWCLGGEPRILVRLWHNPSGIPYDVSCLTVDRFLVSSYISIGEKILRTSVCNTSNHVFLGSTCPRQPPPSLIPKCSDLALRNILPVFDTTW